MTQTAGREGTAAGLSAPALMVNPIRRYAWGSRTALASWQGRRPTDDPEAELWMGAHPSDPSHLLVDSRPPISLLDAIEADPRGMVGDTCAARFGPRLPFLLKVLAIERPLSIQVHPSSDQAARGFARESLAGIPLDAPERTYLDREAKPEMFHAVTPSHLLVGLRDGHAAGPLIRMLAAPRLTAVEARLRAGGPGSVIEAITTLVTWPEDDRAALVAEVVRGARAAWESGRASVHGDAADAMAWVVRLADLHPCDPLVVAPLLLGVERLSPGDTVFVPPGVPHAYLEGMGVEAMCCSDNVVRAGLTSKHVDPSELLALLDPSARPIVGLPAQPLGPAEVAWIPPVEEFLLARIDVSPDSGTARPHPAICGPQVWLCLSGEVAIATGDIALRLRAGASAFVAASAAPVRLRGAGRVFRAAARASSSVG
jgi:mannose-6-phosphate isomerase